MLNYETSFQNALEQLRAVTDLTSLAAQKGAVLEPRGDGWILSISFFGQMCRLLFPELSFEHKSLNQDERILLLHYLLSKGSINHGAPMVTFAGLQGGMFYYPTFRKRGPNRVIKDFAKEPGSLARAANKVGWPLSNLGDVSVSVPVLPNISATIVVHAGDDEFPPEAQFLFNKSITDCLPLEDVAVIGTLIATRLVIAKYS